MKKQILSKEFVYMQKLAGIITESEYIKLLEDQVTIDRILDKISAQGMDSLTDEEKEYLNTNGKSSIPNLGTTEIYVSEPSTELYKIENFPSMPNATDISFDCNADEETCLNTPEMVSMLKNNDFKKIIDKIGSNYKSSWRSGINLDLNPFHYIEFQGNFSSPLDVAYAQVAGDSGLYFVDTLNRFNTGYKTEEGWGVKGWKKL